MKTLWSGGGEMGRIPVAFELAVYMPEREVVN